VQLWDLTPSEPDLRLSEPCAEGSAESFRKDGSLLALPFGDGSLNVYATDTGKPRYRLKGNGIRQRPCLHPTEPIVALCSYWSNLLEVRDLETESLRCPPLRLPWRGSATCCWSPDGRLLAVSEGGGIRIHLYAFDPVASSMGLRRILSGSAGGSELCFNAAGDRIAIHGWSGKIHLFDVVSGRELFSTPNLGCDTTSIRFDQAGKRLKASLRGVFSVADSREYRVLVHQGPGHYNSFAIHPGGRLASMGLSEGLSVFDLETGAERAVVPVAQGVGGVCFDASGNLLSTGKAGLFRWPVRPDRDLPGKITLGPPERLPFPLGDRNLSTSRDGQVVANATFGNGAWLLRRGSRRSIELGTAEVEKRYSMVSVSPDGRWVACGPHITQLNVYDAATGERVWKTPADGHAYGRFTSDGNWLLTEHDGGRAYAVGTWTPGPRLGPGTPCDLSPDMRLAVVAQTDGIYRLVEMATGREVVRLEDPDQNTGGALFTPDGIRLVMHGEGLRVWDLRRLRAELVKLGLDWNMPAYSEPADHALEPLEVRTVGADWVDPERERAHALLALAFNPFDAEAHLRLGMHLLNQQQYGPAHAHLGVALAFRPDLDAALYPRAMSAYF
jgi:WD40 repeat protein